MVINTSNYNCSFEVIQYYKQYENKNVNVKSTKLNGTEFILDARYKIVEKSNITQNIKQSWLRSIWYSISGNGFKRKR